MQVIFLHIPATTQVEDLLRFAQSGAGAFFHRIIHRPVVHSVEILEITDPSTYTQEFHGLVTYASPALGERAISRLNGRKFRGRAVSVRAYNYRAPGDRRVTPRNQGLNRPEDRRRPNLVVKRRNL